MTARFERLRCIARARISICVLIVFMACPAPAFKIPIHRAITEEVLRYLAFNEKAILEIADANECVDHGPNISFTQLDKPCVPDSILVAPGAIAWQHVGAPENHFDNEEIAKGINRVRLLKSQIVGLLKAGRYVQARKLLGAAIHTLQDFYAHSNWVELRHSAEKLGQSAEVFTTMDSGPLPAGIRLAGKEEAVCHYLYSQDLLERVTQILPKLLLVPEASYKGSLLTSGYFLVPNPSPSKCNHGDVPSDGINKDLPDTHHGTDYFAVARHLAHQHTQLFILDVLEKMRANPPTVGWEKGLKEFTAPSTGMTECDCPNPIGTHVHDEEWFDVNAQKMNDTGLIVRAGDQVRIEVRNGRISWGLALGIFGPRLFSSPAGDASVNRANHPGWVEPPLPQYPVGLLFGVIMDATDEDDPLFYFRKPGFPVGNGGIRTMPKSGKLFLGINDGYLGNNIGCFQVRLVP
jgi:hypothetical protein